METRKVIRRILWGVAILAAVCIAVTAVCDTIVSLSSRHRIYSRVEDVPPHEMGLVLGTSPVSYWTGRRNLYFDERIRAAADLYKTGKVRRLVVSGGDYRKAGEYGYDEPACMRDSLIRHGVDSSAITLDYDGTRTLRSIRNMPDRYHTETFIIISQEYHNQRALYQANHLGLDAIAYNARTPQTRESWIRNRGREALARVKLFIDLCQTE